MNGSNLEPVRHGENDVVDVEPKTSDKVMLPVSDIDKLKFMEKVKTLLSTCDLDKKIEENMDVFFTMFNGEMMARKSAVFEMSQQNMVFLAFDKSFPAVKIEEFVQPEHPNFTQFETVFEAFAKSQKAIIDASVKACEFFDRACALCIEIENISADESRQADVKQFDIQTTLNVLIDLHKGINRDKIKLT